MFEKGEQNSQGKCSFSLESLKFFDSCSVAGATQCHGNTGICFHQRVAFLAKLAAAIDEALTGKHFHTPCARRGVLHQWLTEQWPSPSDLLPSSHCPCCVLRCFLNLFSAYQDAGWQWTQGCLRICTLQGQNSKGEKNRYCVTISFPAQQSSSFLQTSSYFLQPFSGSSPKPALRCGIFWKKLVFSFAPESSLCHLWAKHLNGLGYPLCFVHHREEREIPWG